MSIQRIKSGVIADSAVTAAKLDDSTSQLFGFRNRIINGAMVIDQRNAGAAVTATNSFPYSVDRWWGYDGGDGSFTMQRSTTAPAGFTNSIVLTVATADASLSSSEQYIFNQSIEGFNIADLGWGTANAKTITVSFWVRSSVTGTYPIAVLNGPSDRSYVSTYTISAADTFEYKTITIPGDTSGTWPTDNASGLMLRFTLGAGSDFVTTANQWNGSYELTTSACTNLMATLNATFYITGVQLEVGSVATPFERRPYGMELSLCQRYYEKSYPASVVPGTATQSTLIWGVGSNTYAGGSTTAAQGLHNCNYKVTKRASPTVRIWSYGGVANTASNAWTGADLASGSATLFNNSEYGFSIFNNTGGNVTTGSYSVIANFDASAEL
jgi:hypothetical protein